MGYRKRAIEKKGGVALAFLGTNPANFTESVGLNRPGVFRRAQASGSKALQTRPASAGGTMPTLHVVEHLDLVEYMGTRFGPLTYPDSPDHELLEKSGSVVPA